jgi:putative ABC transport system permease protein
MLFYWLLSSAFRAQPGRWLAAGFTVALGIALAVAIHTVNRSALGEFGRALDLVNGQASAQLVSVSGDLPDSIFDEIVARQQSLGIRSTSPVLKRDTGLITVLGIDVFRAAQVTPALMPSAASGQGMSLFGGDSIFLSAAALQSLDLAIGDPLTLPIGDREETFTIAGLVPGAAGQSLAVMDLGLAQWRLNGMGQLSRLDIVPEPGQSFDAIARAVGALNLGLTLVTADDRDRRMSNLSRAYRVNLSVLALVALFTGAFLVFTTISFSVLRQQSQLALLSVLGAKRQWLFALVLTQALIVTAFGGLLGLGIGLGLAGLLLRVAGGDLGGGYFSTAVPPLDIDPIALLGFWVLSLAVGVLAGYFPARAATNASPIKQLRSGAAERLLKPVLHYRVAIGLGAVSLVLAFMPAIGGLPIAAYLSIAFLLFAGLALTPSLVYHGFSLCSQFLLRGKSRNSSFTLAIWRLAQAPASAAGLIAGVIAALALTVAMVVMVSSFRDSVTLWLDQVLPADLYASLGTANENASEAESRTQIQTALLALDGIERVSFTLQQAVLFRPDRPEVALIARPVPPGQAADVLPLTGQVFAQGLGSTKNPLPEVFVSEAMTDLYDWRPGDVHTLPMAGVPGGQLSVFVAGVFRDYGRQHGSIVIDSSVYQSLTNDRRHTGLAIWLAPQANPAAVLDRLRAAVPAYVELRFRSATDLRALSLTIFDRSFALTYALEVAALLVALFSVAAGFAGQALLRQKEYALIYHLGQSTGQRIRWITAESGLLLALAAGWGTVLGLLMSQILIHRVNPQSFHWTMQTSLPTIAIIVLMLSIVLLGIVAAVWASHRNLKPDHLALSLREDW